MKKFHLTCYYCGARIVLQPGQYKVIGISLLDWPADPPVNLYACAACYAARRPKMFTLRRND